MTNHTANLTDRDRAILVALDSKKYHTALEVGTATNLKNVLATIRRLDALGFVTTHTRGESTGLYRINAAGRKALTAEPTEDDGLIHVVQHTRTSHADCEHLSNTKDRTACRKARAKGETYVNPDFFDGGDA